MKRYNKGHILCITLAVLALLSVLSIMFMSTSSVERNVSSMAIQNCNAKLAAEAGLEYGISQLRKDFGGTRPVTALGTGNWWYQKPMRIITSVQNTTNNSDQTVEELFDNAAVEVPLDALHKKQDSTTDDVQVLAVPSYCVSNEEEITEGENNPNESENESADNIKKNIITQFIPQNAPKNISGVCGNTSITTFTPSVHFPFTLKIVDTTSQFPLNTHVSQHQMNQLMGITGSSSNNYDNNAIAIVGEMLNHLSEEVAKLSAWQSYNPNDSKGPLHGLGTEIIRKRNNQKNSDNKYCGFLSKYDIVGKYTKCANASSDEITLEDLSYIWDYITVQPTWKEMAVQNIYRQIAPINGTEKQYRIEYRCPININTASYPVLMAVLQGISKAKENSTSQNITIDHSLANNIAKNIIEIRSGKKIQHDEINTTNDAVTFKTWTSFNYFIDVLNETYSSNTTTANWFTDDSWGMIKANFNPNVHLKKTNPDLIVYQNVTKPELSSYTTEFCFFPLGYFEITSLGEQYDDKGNILNSYHIGTTAHIYNTLYHTSQYDFEGGTSGYQTVLTNQNVNNKGEYVAYDPSNIASRISLDYKKAGNNSQSSNYGTGYNAFTLGNNIYQNSSNLKTLWQNASKLYGAVTPVGYHWSNFSENKNIDSSGNTLYTGSTTLDNDKNAYVFQENFSGDNIDLTQSLRTNAFPSPDPSNGEVDHSNASYLFSDGLYLQPGMPVQMYEIDDTNFPPINNDDPLENKGTILFWFKINNQWNDNANDEFHTVFLSNQVKDDIQVQREIKFKVEKPTETALQQADNVFTSAEDYNIKSHTKQYLRKLSIEFISRVTGNELEASNYAYKEIKRTVVFDPCQNLGIHAQEWYHLAVRWQDSKQEIVTPNDETTGEETPFSNGKPTGEENTSETGSSETDTSETDTSEGDFSEENTSEENTQDDNNIIESSLSSHIVLCGNFYTAHDRAIIQNDSQAGRIYDTHELTVSKDEKAGESGEYNLTVLKSIEKTLVTSNTEVTQYTNDEIKETNFFFIGSPNSGNTPHMTIDDFRISALSESTIDENSKYFPSHAPYANKTDLKISSTSNSSSNSDDIKCYAIYQGRMKLPNDIPTEQRHGSITSFAWTSYGDSSLRGHYTANITYANEITTSDSENSSEQNSENSSSNESEEDSEIDFTKAFELIFTGGSVNKNMNYDKAKGQKQLNLETWIYKKVYDNGNIVLSKNQYFHTLENDNYLDWRNLANSNLTSEEQKVLNKLEQDYTNNKSKSSGHARYGRSFSSSDKYPDGKLTTSYQVKINNNTIPGEYYVTRKSDGNGNYWHIRYLYDMIFDNIDDLLKYYITTWNRNYSGLLEPEPEPEPEPTYKEKAIKSAIVNFKTYSTVDDCIVPEQGDLPYIFTENIDSWVYEIVFPVSTSESSNNNQVFNNAIIDDVTLFYLLDKTDISDRYTVH